MNQSYGLCFPADLLPVLHPTNKPMVVWILNLSDLVIILNGICFPACNLINSII